jgi:hypothetical protein
LIDNSTAAIADVKVIPAASCGGFNLNAVRVASGEAIAVRRIPAAANPSGIVIAFVCNLFHIVFSTMIWQNKRKPSIE